MDVELAFKAGFRAFDTAIAAEWYDERAVAEGLRGQKRGTLWITTKIHPRDLGYERTMEKGLDSVALHKGVDREFA